MSEATVEIGLLKKGKNKQCKTCLRNIKGSVISVCDSCEEYANQDYRSQRELLLPDWALEQCGSKCTHADVIGSVHLSDLKRFNEILDLGELTKQQRRVLFYRFSQDLSYSEIAKILGVSKTLVFRQSVQAIRKLGHRLTILHK